MPFDPRMYMKLMFYTICAILICTYVFAGEKILHSKIKSISPDKVDGQYCYVKVEIIQEGDTITKREILECADGRKAPDTPGYWELFAQFYYHDVNTPEYCRYYSRKGHAFKTPGKVCLDVNGEWEVR